MSHAADSPPPLPPSQGAPTSSATSAPSTAAPAKQRPPRLALLIATGFGLGYLPKAPGTWGSLLGVLMAWALWAENIPSPFAHPEGISFGRLHVWPASMANLVLLVGLAVAGVVSAARAASYFGKSDPQPVVVDEISGQLVALLSGGLVLSWTSDAIGLDSPRLLVLTSPNWKYLLAGLILFRVFDIWKPWPVRQAEKLPGGWGIMADDWVAGIYAALCLWGLRSLGL